ncbi:MAG: prohead protease/major capsid protein fusion protein [Pseudomonadota bacterium]
MSKQRTKKAKSLLFRNNQNAEQLSYRLVTLAASENKQPASLDDKTRSVEVVAGTENPVRVFDMERWDVVEEVLLMSGCRIPASRQLPLLDSHPWQYKSPTTGDVIGSARELKIENNELVARAYYSSVAQAEDAWTKTKEGHLTDYSLGYRVVKAEWVPENETAVIAGRTFTGPVKVATEWIPRELSTTPIGADEQAKARSEIKPNIHKEEKAMNEKLRKFLEARGLAKESTEEQAWSFLETLQLADAGSTRAAVDTPPAPAPVKKTEDELRMESARAEQGRILEIRAMADQMGYDEDKTMTELIKGNKSIEEARKIVMDHFIQTRAAATKEGAGYRPATVLIVDQQDKFRAAAEHSLQLRGGITLDKPADGAVDLRGYSLVEMARTCLRLANKPISGSPLEMVGRALTTSDFPFILAATANKFLFEGYMSAEETWPIWCGEGQVSDFKANTINRAGETDDLDEIPESGEYKYGSRTEAKETYQIATYGKMFAISRQAIINDDLGALTDIPRQHGEAASRKIGDLPYAVLVANAAMGDGTALFHANHGNLAGVSAAITVTSLGAGVAAMKLQKDIGGKRRLNIRPQFLIAPVVKETISEQLLRSAYEGLQANPNQVNPYAGTFFSRVYEPRLDDASSTAWYLAGPKGKTITVFFLNGNKTPFTETKNGWSVDGVEYKVRIDAVAKAVDWKAIYKNAGA